MADKTPLKPLYITKTITLEQIQATNPATVYFAQHTCWWTHDPEHVMTHPVTGARCDPRGGSILEMKAPAFFKQAKMRTLESVYGPNGMDVFIAAHHLNCHVSETDLSPTCGVKWSEYFAPVSKLKASLVVPKLIRNADLTEGELPERTVQNVRNPSIFGEGDDEGEDEEEDNILEVDDEGGVIPH